MKKNAFLEGSLDDSNQQMLFKNLDDNLKASLEKIQRYCEEYPEWKSGRKLIPTRVDPRCTFFNREVQYTTAEVFNSNPVGLLNGVADKIKQGSSLNSPACLRIEGPIESTPLISFKYDESKPLVMFVPNQSVINPKKVLTQYVDFAETIDDVYSNLFGQSWSNNGDHVRFWFGSYDEEKEYKTSFDKMRVHQMLEFHGIAKLILHIRELEKIQKQPVNMQTALIVYQSNAEYPFLSTQQVQGNRYLLSEKNLTWIKQQIILKVTNGHLEGNIYRDNKVCLETKSECLARLKSEVALILTTNIRELFSATELLSLISVSAYLFDERVEKQQFPHDGQKDGVKLITDNRTNFASQYIFAKKVPQLARFLKSLAPLFTFNIIIEKLKQDKAAAIFLFNCLFGDQAQYKAYYDLSCRSAGPCSYNVANSSGFLE